MSQDSLACVLPGYLLSHRLQRGMNCMHFLCDPNGHLFLLIDFAPFSVTVSFPDHFPCLHGPHFSCQVFCGDVNILSCVTQWSLPAPALCRASTAHVCLFWKPPSRLSLPPSLDGRSYSLNCHHPCWTVQFYTLWIFSHSATWTLPPACPEGSLVSASGVTCTLKTEFYCEFLLVCFVSNC